MEFNLTDRLCYMTQVLNEKRRDCSLYYVTNAYIRGLEDMITAIKHTDLQDRAFLIKDIEIQIEQYYKSMNSHTKEINPFG